MEINNFILKNNQEEKRHILLKIISWLFLICSFSFSKILIISIILVYGIQPSK